MLSTRKSNGQNIDTGANSDNDGLTNTTKIVTTQGATITNYAAGLCQSYTGGGYHDWFLPAKSQLNCLYQNRAAIGNNFVAGGYWSSTQVRGGLNDGAWYQNFADGSQAEGATSIASIKVRCVRNLAS